jgi:predicted AAA+ superfamily ATPase
LLGIASVSALLESPFLGSLWEAFVCGQICRELQLRSTAASLWFWRDAHGLEVDFLLDVGSRFELVECKWTESPGRADAASLDKLRAVLEKHRPVRSRLACRVANPFPLAENAEAVNGFLERTWVREG